MTTTYKRWTGLGLSAFLVAGCGDTEPTAAEKAVKDKPTTIEGEAGEDLQAVAPILPDAGANGEGVAGERGEGEAGEGGEGEGGEAGGEGGEGGINVDNAATDPVVFKSGLAIVEAHVIAARDAYAVGRTEAAGEMFAHPVAEVLVDMEPVFTLLEVDKFEDLLIEASDAAYNNAAPEAINALADKIITALNAAADKAPVSDLSAGDIQAAVVSDQIERAVAQYPYAIENEEYGPYLDGYGYYKTAAAINARSREDIAAANDGAVGAIDAALTLLAAAYPTVERPASLDADQSALFGASSQLKLALSN